MADERLTNKHYVDLATKIRLNKMKRIALKHFNLSETDIDHIITDNKDDTEKQIREMIRKWACRPENCEHQIIKLAKKLYEAAKDGDVDAYDVFEVLGVKREVALAFEDPVPVPAPQLAPSAVNGTGATAAPSSGPALTEIMMDNLSRQITNQTELRNLATRGLRVGSNITDTSLTDVKEINNVALKVIKEWALNKRDKSAAYRELCEILTKIKRSAWINVLVDDYVD